VGESMGGRDSCKRRSSSSKFCSILPSITGPPLLLPQPCASPFRILRTVCPSSPLHFVIPFVPAIPAMAGGCFGVSYFSAAAAAGAQDKTLMCEATHRRATLGRPQPAGSGFVERLGSVIRGWWGGQQPLHSRCRRCRQSCRVTGRSLCAGIPCHACAFMRARTHARDA